MKILLIHIIYRAYLKKIFFEAEQTRVIKQEKKKKKTEQIHRKEIFPLLNYGRFTNFILF